MTYAYVLYPLNPSLPFPPMCFVNRCLIPPNPPLPSCVLYDRTGALIGIDFGVAFGIGTSALPVPELMPFRLTRQLTRYSRFCVIVFQ